MLTIEVTKTAAPKEKPLETPDFGRVYTDHMFMMDYSNDKGWENPRIIPFGDLSLSPASMVFHYGQEMFEGLKAYRDEAGGVRLFRPDMNAKRTNQTCERLVMPTIPEEDFVAAIQALVKIDSDWLLDKPGYSLYIRPFMIATEPFLGVTASASYSFIIILSPCGSYFNGDWQPIGLWVEEKYVRAVAGGVGFAKTGGNYAASFAAAKRAKEAGYDQVLWLDGVQRKYIEEAGFMNIFFKIGDRIVTPSLSGSILPGVTRDTVLQLCEKWGYQIEERPIEIKEILVAIQADSKEVDSQVEVFGSGTAAVIMPVGKFGYQDKHMKIGNGQPGALCKKLYETITAIQRGEAIEDYGWSVAV